MILLKAKDFVTDMKDETHRYIKKGIIFFLQHVVDRKKMDDLVCENEIIFFWP